MITLDFELGWGAIENGLWEYRENSGVYDNLRSVMPQLLDLLVELEIPVTWATVGGMVDKTVYKNLDHLPMPIREVTKNTLKKARASSFDGRDLVELVERTPGQRIASHSYSHVRFSYPGVTSSFIESEMENCSRLWKEQGNIMDTFVFPQNHEGYFDVLHRHGIHKVRGAEISRQRNILKKVWTNALKPPPLSSDSIHNGLKVSTGSIFFKTPPKQWYRLGLLELQIRRGLQLAINRHGMFHIYLHPFNLAESKDLLSSFIDLLKYLSKKRDYGLLDIIPF